MPAIRLSYALLGLTSVTAYFIGRELLGGVGAGALSLSLGLLLGAYLTRQLAQRSLRAQWITIATSIFLCVVCLLGTVWYTHQRTAKMTQLLLGTWQARDAKGSFVLEIGADSTYFTDSTSPHRLSYTLRPSLDSLILLHESGSHLRLPLAKLTPKELVVGEGSNILTFRKSN